MGRFWLRVAAACGMVAMAPATWADLLVSNYVGGSVLRFADDSTPLGAFVASGAGGLAQAAALHFGPDGNLYVAGGAGIAVFDGTSGSYLRSFGPAGALDFTFDAAGNLYAVDNQQVLAYDASGTLLRSYSDGISTPQGILMTAGGRLLVTNTYGGNYANTLTQLDPVSGAFATFATGLGEPVGIAAGPDGRYYVANYTFANGYGGSHPDTVQVVDRSGGASTTWNVGGALHGATYLAFHDDGLYVTSYYNGTVQVFNAATGTFERQIDGAAHAYGIAFFPSAVPEAPSAALLALGGLMLLGRRRRRPRGTD